MLSRHGSVAVAQIVTIAPRRQNCSRQAQFVERIYGGKRGAASRGTDVETLENARIDLSADSAQLQSAFRCCGQNGEITTYQ